MSGELEQLRERCRQLSIVITGHLGGGSEWFSRIGDDFYADPTICRDGLQRMKTDAHITKKALVRANKQARARGEEPLSARPTGDEAPLTPYGEQMQEALEALTFAEASYRSAHDLFGDGSREAGREWDLMRRAGDRARALLQRETNQ